MRSKPGSLRSYACGAGPVLVAVGVLTSACVTVRAPASDAPASHSALMRVAPDPDSVADVSFDTGSSLAAIAAAVVLGLLARSLWVEQRRRQRAELDASRYLATMAHLDRRAVLGGLVASLAHELNQPLAAILRNAEAARMLLASGQASEQELREIVEDIVKDDRRAGDLIRRMRTLLRRRELEAQPVNLNAVARDTIDLIATEAASKRIGIELRPSHGSSLVTGDRVHLQQVLLNLVLNGMDAMADTPDEQRHLVVRTHSTNGHVSVSVEDAGRGIASDALSHIFDPFFTTKIDGLGVGLSIARTIVEAHDGRIVAENNPDRGATVRFTLPVRLGPKDDVHDAQHSH
jgi:signal transduction histidine kinase